MTRQPTGRDTGTLQVEIERQGNPAGRDRERDRAVNIVITQSVRYSVDTS